MEITVFTPTYNREKTLTRAYNSLLNQSKKDFVWLIIDDGSTDGTKSLVDKWITEEKLQINYHYKENGGKHTAMRLAHKLTTTKYLTGLDSDDEFTADTIETFYESWRQIEATGKAKEFAEISALTYDTKGSLVGNYSFSKSVNYIDSNWHEMVLKFRNNNEHVTCWDVQKLRECIQIPENLWLSNKINFLAEFVFWARLGRLYKTRYLNRNLRIYHYDGGDSLLRIEDKTKGHYNNVVGSKYFLDENLSYFFSNPKYFINLILKFIISSIELGLSPLFIMKSISTLKFKMAYCLVYPIGLVLWFYYKKIKKQFWF